MEIDPTLFLNLGLAGFLSIYLVYFITNKLNSKLDNLAEKIDKLSDSIEKLLVVIDVSRSIALLNNTEDTKRRRNR